MLLENGVLNYVLDHEEYAHTAKNELKTNGAWSVTN